MEFEDGSHLCLGFDFAFPQSFLARLPSIDKSITSQIVA